MSKKIMVVDDEARLLSVVKAYLSQEGYQVVVAANGREALVLARQEKPDLIILDIMMPELDGYEFIRMHRKERETPIIMLTAKVEDSDQILGLELGADDYVTKPFSPRVLIARVRAILRRTGQSEGAKTVLRMGELVLDPAAHQVQLAQQPVDLTPSEFDLLAVMLAAPGRAFSRLELLDRLQGVAYDGYERTIDVHIKNIRAKIETDPRQPRYIETVYGIGYRMTTGV